MKCKYIFEEGDKELLLKLEPNHNRCFICNSFYEDYCKDCSLKKQSIIRKEIEDKHLTKVVKDIFHLHYIENEIRKLQDNALETLEKYDEESKQVINSILCNMLGIKTLKRGK